MSAIPPWFERKFSFDFPVEFYPNFCVRLRGTPPRLEDLARGLTREQLTQRLDAKWSIQENAGHLLDLEPLGITRLDDYLRGAETLSPADLTNRKTQEARHNDPPWDEILSAFRQARAEFCNRLEALRPADFARFSRHPRLNQSMRLVDFLYFICEHDDHHLARIWEIRRSLTAR
ncbi:MAG: DinB family protein [Candidatus Acidiferrales bacterium]